MHSNLKILRWLLNSTLRQKFTVSWRKLLQSLNLSGWTREELHAKSRKQMWSTLVDLDRRWSTLFDIGRPWSTMVFCIPHRSENPGRPWSTVVDLGRPWSTLVDLGRPCSTLVDHGRPWPTVVDIGRADVCLPRAYIFVFSLPEGSPRRASLTRQRKCS